jgi:hypothetical protein
MRVRCCTRQPPRVARVETMPACWNQSRSMDDGNRVLRPCPGGGGIRVKLLQETT